MADSLDSIVKGAPAAVPARDISKAVGGTSPISSSSSTTAAAAAAATSKPGDPLSHTPSSPSMIYLNLLILEASLRAQYLELRARRRHHSFFLTLLTLWTAAFGYALWFAPREDGIGVGGSVYWVVETTERVCFLGGVITAILVWATGIWDRGVRWPRKWFATSNRGLRGFNCKLVVIKQPWWAETLSTVGWFLTYGLFSKTAGCSYRYVEPAILGEVDKELNLTVHGHPNLPAVGEDEEKGGHEEDLSPGGDYVKLLLLPKPFSATFRENWELYRTEYWDRENERRALLAAKLKERDIKLRRQQGGWFWWLPGRRPAADKHPAGRVGESEKAPHNRHLVVPSEHRRTRSGSVRRGSTSTAPSRSPTPSVESEDAGISRQASNASSTSDKRRKKASRPQKRTAAEPRAITPEMPSPLGKESAKPSGSPSARPGSSAGDRLRPTRSPSPKPAVD